MRLRGTLASRKGLSHSHPRVDRGLAEGYAGVQNFGLPRPWAPSAANCRIDRAVDPAHIRRIGNSADGAKPMTIQTPRVLPDLAALMARLEKLEAENAALKTAKPKATVDFKVSPKGCVTVTGVTTPFHAPTLYPRAWLAILDRADEMRAFIMAHKLELSWTKDAARGIGAPAD